MELKWDEAPASGPVPFSKDIFDKFTLAPTVKELWAILHSPDVKEEVKDESKVKPTGPLSNPKPSGSSINTAQANSRNSHGSAGSALDCSDPLSDCKKNLTESKDTGRFPDPEVPYPCYSSLTYKEHLTYLQSLKTKKYRTAPQNLMNKVKNEVAEFMKYLQDVSKVRAEDYKYIPPEAFQYLEEYFKASLDYLKNYPQVYSIQGITSLAGGKFVSDICLDFEKQLLAMGSVNIVEKKMLPEKIQLSVDYDSVSAGIPPFKKASHFHTAISSDTNAEKLSATYEPHVCLAKEAFFQLLNNSAEYMEAWELPVWVKENSGQGSSKTVYIDPPLLQTQMTYRERNHLIHQESVKLAYKKTGQDSVFFLTTEDFTKKADFVTEEKSSRAVVSFDDTGIDFEVDVTELESFGESCHLSKKVKDNSEPKASSKSHILELSKPKLGSDHQGLTEVASTYKDIPSPPLELAEQELQDKSDAEDSSMARSTEDTLTSVSEDPFSNMPGSTVEECSSTECPPTKRTRYNSDHSVDSEEERLIIDHPSSLVNCTTEETQLAVSAQENLTDNVKFSFNKESIAPAMSPPSAAKGTKKGTKRSRISGDCDQLGQILRMQKTMLKSALVNGQEPPKAQTSDCTPEPTLKNNPYSLVKPCVSSYLHSREGLDEEVPALPTCQPKGQRKRLLREELLASAEDELDFKPPQENSVLYKLYSLQDVLLMVRSTVEFAQHIKNKNGMKRAVPVNVLSKLEYQLCYGAESLTHTEACQLWAEQLLHSSTVSFIGRINAHTSEVVQLQELPADWIQNTSCDFKPARCLNSLHHMLKKLMGLQEGRYLLGHKPGEAFVTVFKASDGKKPTRSLYDLQEAHCGPPVVPLHAKVPWIPLDPHHLMPFHLKHNRPPCTFPPNSRPQHKQQTGGGQRAKQGRTMTRPTQGSQNSAAVPCQKKKKKKRKKKTNAHKKTVMSQQLQDMQTY